MPALTAGQAYPFKEKKRKRQNNRHTAGAPAKTHTNDMQTPKRLTLILATLLTATISIKAQMVAVSTDVPWLLMQSPNVAAEIVVGNKSSVVLSVMGNHKPWGKDLKMIAVQPEYRYYFSARPMHHWFVGIGAVAAAYNITWSGKVYHGDAYGGGLTLGYVWNLTKRLGIDFHAGVGLISYKQKEYFVHDNFDADYTVDGTQRTNATGNVLLPTRVGVSVSYILR